MTDARDPVDAPWRPQREVDPSVAARLIARARPDLRGVELRPLGAGWDNTVFLVGGRWVARFPRRAVAVPLLEREARVVPAVADHLPLEVPRARVYDGAEVCRTAGCGWPFALHDLVPGRSAAEAGLGERERAALAAPLGAFLAALHGVGAQEARGLGAVGDELRRLDVAHRAPRVRRRLARAVALGEIADARPWERVVEATPPAVARRACLVHGDLYALHVLVDENSAACGVIDWGDVHAGDPAVDLAVAHSLLPPATRGAFIDAYGGVEETAWALARFRALDTTLAVLLYALDTGREAVAREARRGMDFIATPNAR